MMAFYHGDIFYGDFLWDTSIFLITITRNFIWGNINNITKISLFVCMYNTYVPNEYKKI